jgi:hypothetical protein
LLEHFCHVPHFARLKAPPPPPPPCWPIILFPLIIPDDKVATVPDPGTAATWSIIFAKEEAAKKHTHKHKTPFPLPYLTQNYLEEAQEKKPNPGKKITNKQRKKISTKLTTPFLSRFFWGRESSGGRAQKRRDGEGATKAAENLGRGWGEEGGR